MHTRQQFGSELRACRWQLSFALIGATILWMLAFPVICDLHWFHSHTTLQGVFVVLSLVLLAISYALIAKLLYNRHGLVCPSCREWMGSQSRMLSTGKCPRCKAEVFHES